jgi:Tfp pilus assembly protein PilF
MNVEIRNLSNAGRHAASTRDWSTVEICARGILERSPREPEGFFLRGLAEKAGGHTRKAVEAFEMVLALDPERYDAAVELANQHSMARRNGKVAEILRHYEAALYDSPRYLNMAGTVYTEVGMPEKAWPLFVRANELQPEISLFQANLAACAVFVGEIEQARETFQKLLEKNPHHQRNHYQLSRLEPAKDKRHIEQMENVLRETKLSPDRNIFLYYALGKEYEDLGEWDTAFEYYQKGGAAAVGVMDYDVSSDIAILDKATEICTREWLHDGTAPAPTPRTPLFVVGLPRTGTTLTERILSSHSRVASVGETEFVQMVIRRESGVATVEKMTPQILDGFASRDISVLTEGYLDAVDYRLHDEPIFVDKLPFNVQYLGFIAKAFPEAPLVLLRRHPMDACFSMFKQVFTWAYKFSYDLDSLGKYYVAYDRMCRHWRELLGDRLVEVEYEKLVADQEAQTRRLLEKVGLPFEPACLDFDKNRAPTSTASSVQVREKAHTRSVNKWRNFADHLAPLRQHLEQAGVVIE